MARALVLGVRLRAEAGLMGPRSPEEPRARELFEALVGRRTGIVRQIDVVETIAGDAPLFHAGAQIANAHPYHGDHLGLGVGGCGITRDEAVLSALCEGVERYAASSYGPDARGLVSRRALGEERSIDPCELLRFTAEQRADPTFPLAPVTQETPLRWERGHDLATGRPCLVPAFAVHLPYMLERDEPLVGLGLSTGLACGETVEQAICKGLCEAVERDSMALVWIRGLTPPRLAARVVCEQVGQLLPPGDEVIAYDLRSDLGLPVFMVMCRGIGPRGALVSVGAACHADPRAALRKAAMEASQDRAYVRMLIERDPAWAPAADFSNVTDFSLHARLYCASEALARRGLAFLEGDVEVGERALEGARPMQAAPLVEALAKRGIEGVVVDLTPPWAASLGLHVTRVIFPGLVPLHGNHLLRNLDHPRLLRWAAAMPSGILRHNRPAWPYPHPMP
jgi:ribosomal protein S12 methylthiotransferase accessory factor